MTVHEQRCAPVVLEEDVSQDLRWALAAVGGFGAGTNYGGSNDEVSHLIRRGHDGGVVWGGGYWIGGYDRYRERTPVQRVADAVHVQRW
jgi:hypothetical protein